MLVSLGHTIVCQSLHVPYITSEYKRIYNIILYTNITEIYSF